MTEPKQGGEAEVDLASSPHEAGDVEEAEPSSSKDEGDAEPSASSSGAASISGSRSSEDIEATLEDADAIDALLAARDAARAEAARKSRRGRREPVPAGAPASIPVPHVAKQGGRRGLDAATVLAMLAFVVVGGLLVFGYAQALLPAAEAQLGAACRPLNPEPREGEAPALELEDLDGTPVSLEDFRGKFVVLNFWATWCEPCTREWPDLAMLGQRMAGRDDVVVLAVGLDENKQDIAPYLARMGLEDTQVRVLWAKDPEAYKRYGSEKIPDTYFVNAEGELEAVFVNVREWGKAAAVRCVESKL